MVLVMARSQCVPRLKKGWPPLQLRITFLHKIYVTKKIISVSLVIDQVDGRIFVAIQFEFKNFYWNECEEMLLLSANILRHSL
jgi:hypothetical protein